MRQTRRFSGGTSALRSAISRCTLSEARTAWNALGNSSRSPSPVVLTIRPPSSAKSGSVASRCALRLVKVPTSSVPISRL
jgi:hypothetical protein